MGLFRTEKRHSFQETGRLDYWDIHSHILPGVDDGAGYPEESIGMLRAEHAQGVRNVVFTPHYRPGMFTVSGADRTRVFHELLAQVRGQFPDMRFFLGCEVHVHADLLKTLQDTANLMCGTNAVLLEYSVTGTFRGLQQSVSQLLEHGCRPVLAHVERYRCIYEAPERILQLRRAGAGIQVNADTFLEKRRSHRKKLAEYLMERHAVDYIASDAHDMAYRPVCIGACAQVITKQYGAAAAERIFRINPEKLFAGAKSYGGIYAETGDRRGIYD